MTKLNFTIEKEYKEMFEELAKVAFELNIIAKPTKVAFMRYLISSNFETFYQLNESLKGGEIPRPSDIKDV